MLQLTANCDTVYVTHHTSPSAFWTLVLIMLLLLLLLLLLCTGWPQC
jgi:hypothetical protein